MSKVDPTFVSRERELEALEAWWRRSGSSLGIVWGRRRVGKTALLERFAEGRRAIFHTATGGPVVDELRRLSLAAGPHVTGVRDLGVRPFGDWEDTLETLADAASQPLLLVLDEFPDLVAVSPTLPARLRALWDRIRGKAQLKMLVCGSAVRVMASVQEIRSPLYGRMDLALRIDPFVPHESALMLPHLAPQDRALVWGLVGGMPMYLAAWDQRASVRSNVHQLLCSKGGFLLNEGELVMATEADAGEGLVRAVLMAIGAGRSKHNEIRDAVGTEPTRVLERLIELRLIERIVPVTEDPARTRRRRYRVADNFLGTWLGLVNPHRAEIERGLGEMILPVILSSLDDHLGLRWEEAFRSHVRRLAAAGTLGDEIVAVGSFWTNEGAGAEIDAVALSGRSRTAVAVGEAKWARRVDARPLRHALERKAANLPRVRQPLRYLIGARTGVTSAGDTIAVTADDVFD